MELDKPSWHQLPMETDLEYEWFVMYCEFGDSRTTTKLARRQGIPPGRIADLAAANDWDARVHAWQSDSAASAKTLIRDEEAVHTVEFQVGMYLIRLAQQGLDGKNPTLFDMKTLQGLLKDGLELARKGSGAADMVIALEDRRGIQHQFADFLGEEDDD